VPGCTKYSRSQVDTGNGVRKGGLLLWGQSIFAIRAEKLCLERGPEISTP
jgi:hypothetical protein